MKIIKIFPDSLGEAIGIQPGDRLLKINGKRVQDEIDYKFRITEQNLILDSSNEPVRHPLINEIFTGRKKGAGYFKLSN